MSVPVCEVCEEPVEAHGAICASCQASVDEGDRAVMGYVAGLIAAFYELPGLELGGLLHVVVDDQNVDDESLDFCAEQVAQGWPSESVSSRLAVMILDGLRPMSEAQRFAVCNLMVAP